MEKRPRQPLARRFRQARGVAFSSFVFAFRLVAVALTSIYFAQFNVATAQSTSAESVPSAPRTRSGENPNEKTTFWLADADGSWNIPLPNWTLEEVMRTIDAREEETSEAPFSIQRVDVFGAARDGLARLTIKFDVNVADGFVRVPLGLREGVYIPNPDAPDETGFSFEGPGFCALDVDPKTGEYVAVIQTEPRRRVPRPAENPEIQNPVPAENPEIQNPVPVENPEIQNPVPAENPENQNPAPVENSENQNPAPAENTESPLPGSEPNAEPSPPVNEENAVPENPNPNENAEPQTAFAAPANGPYSANAEADDKNDDVSLALRDRLNATRLRPRQFSLTLELCFVVETLGADEFRLRASFPNSVHSQMTLEAPIADAKVEVVKGAIAGPPTSLSETSTELKFHGLGRGGETTEISWRKDVAQRLENRVVYQVEDAEIAVELAALETAFEATLPIRAFGGETDVFLVRLPKRAALDADGVAASGLDDETLEIRNVRELDDNGEKTVEIQLAEKTSAATLKLRTIVPVVESASGDVATSNPPREISGFNVVGAQKQYGQITIKKAEELDFNVVPTFGVRAGTDRSTRLNDEREVYSFFSQPFSLDAQAFVRQIVVNVKPEYQTTIAEKDAALRARFQYSIYGAKINELKIRLNDWNLAGSIDDSIFDVAGIFRNETTGETIFPLKTPTEGIVELELSAARPLDAPNGEFALELPTPIADWVESGPCVVVPADAVELTPRQDRCVGLTPKSTRQLALELELPKSQQTLLAFQTEQRFAASNGANETPTPTPTTFAARIEKLEQKIEIEAKAEIRISELGEKQVLQTFVYRVAREPLDAVEIQTPIKLLEAANAHKLTNLKFFVDGKLVPPQNLQLETLDGSSDFAVRRVLLSNSPKIGSFVVSVQYDGGTVDLKPEMTSKIEFYLMQPGDETLVSNELTIFAPLGVSLDYVQNDSRFWELEESNRSTDGRSAFSRYRSTTREFLAAFNGALGANDNLGVAIVDRAWIQTWISGETRLDRVAYRVSTDRDHLELKLPSGVRQERVAVSIDRVPLTNAVASGSAPLSGGSGNGSTSPGSGGGNSVSASGRARTLFGADGTLRVPISDELRKREFVLEIAYSLDRTTPTSARRWAFDFPEFVGDSTWIRRAYWQIVTPSSRCVVGDPTNWTPEHVVRRGPFGVFKRVPALDQTRLCDWIGIPAREEIPSEVNVYLFGGFDQPTRSRIYVVDRALLALIGGGATLAFGLALIYAPFFRSRGVIFAIAIALATLVAIRPLLALLLLQTTVLGVALTLATALAAKFFGRKDAKTRSSAAKIVRSVSAAAPDQSEQRALNDGERKKRGGGSSRVVAPEKR